MLSAVVRPSLPLMNAHAEGTGFPSTDTERTNATTADVVVVVLAVDWDDVEKLKDVVEPVVDMLDEVGGTVVVCPEDVDPVADDATLEVGVKLVAEEEPELETELLDELTRVLEDRLATVLLVDETLDILVVLDDAVLVLVVLLADLLFEDD